MILTIIMIIIIINNVHAYSSEHHSREAYARLSNEDPAKSGLEVETKVHRLFDFTSCEV